MDIRRLAPITSETIGVFTAAMAEAAGLSTRDLARLVRRGEITRVAGRGFVVGDVDPTAHQRAVAACLTWPEAVVCYRTAAQIHGFPVADDDAAHVLVPNGRRPVANTVPHFWSIAPGDVEVRGRIRVTDRRTTLADCLGRLPEVEAWGLLAWLWTRDRITLEDVEAQITARKGLYGIVRLRAMAAVLRRGAVSPAEVALQDFLIEHEFTGWRGDQKIIVRGRIIARVDILFLEEGVILEFDGALAHPDGLTAKDKRRQQRLRRLGYHVIRVRWSRMMFDARGLVEEIRMALEGQAA